MSFFMDAEEFMPTTRSLILLASIAIAACGTAPSRLTPTADAPLVLRETVSMEQTAAAGGARFRVEIVAGVYQPAGSDGAGTYFQGPPACWRRQLIDPSWTMKAENKGMYDFADCGFYVPKKPERPVLVYLVTNSGLKYPISRSPDAYGVPQVPDLALDAVATQNLAATAVASNPALAGAKVGPTAVGPGIGMGVVAGLIALETGNLTTDVPQPAPHVLRAALRPLNAPQ
jgi:hypothetical protein